MPLLTLTSEMRGYVIVEGGGYEYSYRSTESILMGRSLAV